MAAAGNGHITTLIWLRDYAMAEPCWNSVWVAEHDTAICDAAEHGGHEAALEWAHKVSSLTTTHRTATTSKRCAMDLEDLEELAKSVEGCDFCASWVECYERTKFSAEDDSKPWECNYTHAYTEEAVGDTEEAVADTEEVSSFHEAASRYESVEVVLSASLLFSIVGAQSETPLVVVDFIDVVDYTKFSSLVRYALGQVVTETDTDTFEILQLATSADDLQTCEDFYGVSYPGKSLGIIKKSFTVPRGHKLFGDISGSYKVELLLGTGEDVNKRRLLRILLCASSDD